MTQLKIYQAVLKAVKAVPGMVPLSVPGRPFTAPSGGLPYGNFNHFPNEPQAFTLGDAGEDMHTGFSQVLLKYPPDKDVFELSRLADMVRGDFKAGQRIFYEDQEVVIVRSGMGQFSQVDNRLVSPISIYWYALTRR